MNTLNKLSIAILLMTGLGTAYAADTCPAENGYGVNAAGECVTQCAAGTYVANAGEPCQTITHGQYYSYAHTVKYGQTSGNEYHKCPSTANSSTDVFIAVTLRPGTTINDCVSVTYGVRYTAADRGNCIANGTSCPAYETNGESWGSCYYTTGDAGNAIYDQRTTDPETGEIRKGCVGGSGITSCDAGYYDPENGQTSNNGPRYRPCQPVDTGYYSPDGDLKRYPCPEKTATCGYGDCAKSIEDCKPYKTIMTSTGVSLIMQPDQHTHPALGLRMPDDGSVWFGRADPGARDGHINIEYDEKPYALINPMDLFIEYTYGGRTFLVREKPL